MLPLVLLCALGLASVGLTAHLAARQGRALTIWLPLGALTGPLAPLLLLAAPADEASERPALPITLPVAGLLVTVVVAVALGAAGGFAWAAEALSVDAGAHAANAADRAGGSLGPTVGLATAAGGGLWNALSRLGGVALGAGLGLWAAPFAAYGLARVRGPQSTSVSAVTRNTSS